MLEATRARLRRRRGRLAVVCAVALLGATVATAHSSVAGDHMGEAAAICLAIVAGSAALAALPPLAGRFGGCERRCSSGAEGRPLD